MKKTGSNGCLTDDNLMLLFYYENRKSKDFILQYHLIFFLKEWMKLAYEKFRQKIVGLQSDWATFKVDFLDRDSFKDFFDYISRDVQNYPEICVTGYFSEVSRKMFENFIRLGLNVRLICQEFPPKLSKRDRNNLEVLKKLVDSGAKIKVNNRLHARFFLAYKPEPELRGLLVIGSFDFNTECIGQERYDAGIKTRNPDLVKSAVELFEQIWTETKSIPLKDFMEKGKH
jgi:hypothetical protein